MSRAALSQRAALVAAVALAAAARQAGAQAIVDRSLRAGPQLVAYRFDTPEAKRITELAFPIAVAVPLWQRLSLDVATAYARVQYDSASASQTISGLTDTQLRASYTFGADNVVLTAGLNLPTGQSTVNLDREGAAAGQIGNDFLAFPISNMGTGFAATGGLAAARTFGAWNLGTGASFRRTVEYEPFDSIPGVGRVRFQPGDEYRLRLGADRALGAGSLAFGVTYFAFGADADGSSTYSSGDRVLAQGGWARPVHGVDLYLSAWNLYRFRGEQAGAVTAPTENIANLGVAAGFHVAGQVVEPNVELRSWMRDGERAGQLALLGLRSRIGSGALAVVPSVSYAAGSVGPSDASTGLSGWRGMVTVQVR